MQTMSTHYTLFKPSGAPLRAKVDLSFVGAMSKRETELVSNLSSPDLTHLVEVRDGDTLPLLCNRIYGDPGYYLEVARFNQLTDFRNLRPGWKLHFPPLE
jgi:nucleoid-associated protein YgaU